MTVGIVSLGCAKNAADLEIRLGGLIASGCTLSKDPGRCDTLVVNTCAFIEAARIEAEREIRRALRLKRAGSVKRVIVAGCYPERYPERAALFPGVDSWEGVPKKFGCQRIPGLRLSGKAYAWLKIAEGCSHRCAYCAIPDIRGRYRSRPLRGILDEARAYVRTGAKELNVIAQDPMMYGSDFRDGTSIMTLLDALERMRGDFKVRVLYSYPDEITDTFLEWLRCGRRAVKYVDVPLQHTAPEILKAMGRGRAVKATLEAADRIRAAVPGVTLRTTVMTGFPGETDRIFGRLLDDVKRMEFDHLGVFAYSPEEGTRAAGMPGMPPRDVAEKRALEIMAAQKGIWKRKASRIAGRKHRALVVSPVAARLESQAPDVDGVVRLAKPAPAGKTGEFADVLVTGCKGWDFTGTVL